MKKKIKEMVSVTHILIRQAEIRERSRTMLSSFKVPWVWYAVFFLLMVVFPSVAYIKLGSPVYEIYVLPPLYALMIYIDCNMRRYHKSRYQALVDGCSEDMARTVKLLLSLSIVEN